MRLAQFILGNVESILVEWEAFARKIWPDTPNRDTVDPATVRDHAEDILRVTAQDMMSPQSDEEQSDKSKGKGPPGQASTKVNRAAAEHGSVRVTDKFDLAAVVAEYRALRASVLRLWRESVPTPHHEDLVDVTRFNESIDQSLTEAVRSYIERYDRERQALLRDEQAARAEAEIANRAKDMFLATLSHELRTPLNAIAGWISILRTKGYSEADFAKAMDVIERNTNAQVHLIEEVLDVSRITAGKLRVEIGDCDLGDVVNAGVEAIRPAAAQRGIALDVQLDANAVKGACDPARFQQIVWNLVSNAIKFTPKGGKVSVRLGRDQSSIMLTVTDNGSGIAPELLPHVFDRFRQADSSTRRKYGGLGLGLSIVKHLVEMHGGTVQVHSDGENRGSTFTVRLPIRAMTALDSAQPPEDSTPRDPLTLVPPELPPVRLDRVRVLVVDDEQDSRSVLSRVLESVGAIVVTAGSAAEALEVIARAKGTLDALVSDVGMPEQDGYDLIHEVRRLGHTAEKLPAIALTGFAQANDEHAAMSAGFQLHIPKPVDLHHLTTAIASLTKRSA